MRYEVVADPGAVPAAYREAVVQHYRDVFDSEAGVVERMVPTVEDDEYLYLARTDDSLELVGGFVVHRRRPETGDLRFRGFIVFPAFRGSGYAKDMIERLHAVGRAEADRTRADVMYARSIVYPVDSEFGNFLRKCGFTPLPVWMFERERPDWEHVGIELYRARGVGDDRLVVFRKNLIKERKL